MRAGRAGSPRAPGSGSVLGPAKTPSPAPTRYPAISRRSTKWSRSHHL